MSLVEKYVEALEILTCTPSRTLFVRAFVVRSRAFKKSLIREATVDLTAIHITERTGIAAMALN
jgi:hypothetical protein